jgi:hypothetical protein
MVVSVCIPAYIRVTQGRAVVAYPSFWTAETLESWTHIRIMPGLLLCRPEFSFTNRGLVTNILLLRSPAECKVR